MRPLAKETFAAYLRRIGFICVLGHIENHYGNPRKIRHGARGRCWDRYAELTVVYDGYTPARPWVRPEELTNKELTMLRLDPVTDRGAYVPYSHDGGVFLRTAWAELCRKRDKRKRAAVRHRVRRKP
ncbi:hypothetical protein L0Y40_00445 [Candidatus Wolfebacteria bacterium]|nr:hypothetical protein [Candidatus Wolfebacteria bacterium]